MVTRVSSSAIKLAYWVALLALLNSPAAAQQTPPDERAVRAVRAVTPPRIDGVLNEEVWRAAIPASRFTQLEPREAVPSTERTEVRLAYDDEALYIGARMYDSGRVTRRLGRRDMDLTASDWLRVSLDSNRDRRTAFRFDANPSGVRRDATLSGEAVETESLAWDAVWEVATTVDAEGWTAEYRIPLSQISFVAAEDQSWGLQIERIIDRLQERAVFSFTPRTQAAGVAAFGELTGLVALRTRRGVEVLPYVSGRTESEGRDPAVGAGVDARLRVAPNLTLSGTINPDFGQVVLDPAVINLTAFETFFEEKRPFFVEGASSFAFPGSSLGPGGGPMQLFYSRRIGRSPQLRAPAGAAEVPEATSIIGAAKLVGRTAGGWSIGALDAVTAPEFASGIGGENDARVLLEPRSNYFAARVQREGSGSPNSTGMIVTAVHRGVSGDVRAQALLRSAAYVAGSDFRREWSGRRWAISGAAVASHVRGSSSAMVNTQNSPTRYFGRPDADHIAIDSSATSLSGYAAHVQLTRQSGTSVRGHLQVSAISPGFEANDIGFQSRADRVGATGTLTYTRDLRRRMLRRVDADITAFGGVNYGGEWVGRGVWGSVMAHHPSFWSLLMGVTAQPPRHDDRLTRGGPLARLPASIAVGWLLRSDPRRALTAQYRMRFEGDAMGGAGQQYELNMSLRPSPRWNLALGPLFERESIVAQYIARVADPIATHTYGHRYVFAALDYSQLSLETRLTMSVTPAVSFELYAQPLLARGSFGSPHEFTTPGELNLRSYDEVATTATEWIIDPDGAANPAPEFRIARPDLATQSLRGSAVARWEWRPGSTLFVVWQHTRAADEAVTPLLERTRALLRARPHNIFAVKATWWLNPRL